jgi:zinc protease
MMRLITLFWAVLFLALPVQAEIRIQEITTPGGIRAWLVNEPSIPIIALNIGFRGGAALDSAGTKGAAYLMTGLLEEGTGDMDAAAFLRAREELAADFGFDAGRDSVTITAQVLKENSAEALALLKQAITAPAFNPQAFERVKGQITSMVASATANPGEIARNRLKALAYPDHPYGLPTEGTAETVAALTIKDIKAIHKSALAKDRVYVGVVGDITAEELGPLLDDLLGELPEVGGPMPAETEFAASGGTTVIDFDTPQSVAVWAHKGIKRHDPEFFAAYVMNNILGGSGFTSRLTEEVREKRGLTYGVYSYLAPFDYATSMGGSVSSSNDRIAEALDVVKAEWARMATGGVTEEELVAAKKFLTGAYPLRFDGNSQIAGILVGMQMQDLDASYITTRNDRINAVTREEIAKVAARLLKPENLRFVVVGRPEGLVSTD